jgi:hypothetical protein
MISPRATLGFLLHRVPDPRLPKSPADYTFLLGTCPRIIAELERHDPSESWGLAINDTYVCYLQCYRLGEGLA